VEPIQVFFDATKERGPAAAVEQMARSWWQDTGDAEGQLRETKQEGKVPDLWIMPMHELGEFFNACLKNPRIEDEMLNVLLIGPGIDLTHPVFMEMDPHGNHVSKRFCRDFVNQGPPIDFAGDGTFCAQIILRICGTAARVYVARVFEETLDIGDRHTVDRIAQVGGPRTLP